MDEDKIIKTGFQPIRFVKARVGQPFTMSMPPDHSEVILPPKIGIQYFREQNQITGIPKQSGSFNVQYCIRKYNDSGVEEFSTHHTILLIESDDQKKIVIMEPDPNDPYMKPDEVAYTIQVNENTKKRLKKDVAAASKRGNEHIEIGKIREDDFYIQYHKKTRWYVLAVADGSGKSQFSRKGSKIACSRAVKSCIERLTAQSGKLKKLTIRYTWNKSVHVRKEIIGKLHDIIASSVMDAYSDILLEAMQHERHPHDYATTLLMCICKKYEFGWLIGAFGVGDGAICVYHKDNWYANLMGGNDHPSMKSFLTTPGIAQPSGLERRIRFTIVDDFSALFLMTNGISEPKFECNADMSCFELWNRFWEDINKKVKFSGKINNVGEALLKWLDFWSPGKYDDRTIAMIF